MLLNLGWGLSLAGSILLRLALLAGPFFLRLARIRFGEVRRLFRFLLQFLYLQEGRTQLLLEILHLLLQALVLLSLFKQLLHLLLQAVIVLSQVFILSLQSVQLFHFSILPDFPNLGQSFLSAILLRWRVTLNRFEVRS